MKKILLSILLINLQLFSLQIGETPPSVSIDGKNGGLIAGGAWESSMINNKVFVMFYVDPDKKDVNEEFADALKKENFNHSNFASLAIINLAATWKPNIIIEAILKKKQKKFPDTIYVKDKKKVLVKEWAMADDASNIVVFSKQGKVLYFKNGKLDESETTKVIQLIKDNL